MQSSTDSRATLLTDRQLASRWQVSRDTIWRWKRAGIIPSPKKVGPNSTRWTVAEIEAHEAAIAAA